MMTLATPRQRLRSPSVVDMLLTCWEMVVRGAEMELLATEAEAVAVAGAPRVSWRSAEGDREGRTCILVCGVSEKLCEALQSLERQGGREGKISP